MPPPRASREELKRIDAVSVALHALLIGAIFVDLVFTEVAANRNENDTVYASPTASPLPSHSGQQENPSGRPVRRLVTFGISFILYLVLKTYEIALSVSWYKYKKFIDECSLIVGGFSLVILILTTTIKFTKYVALPAYLILVLGRFIFMWPGGGIHEFILEFLYIKCLQLQQLLSYCWYSCKMFIPYLKFKKANCAMLAAGRKVNLNADQHAIDAYLAKQQLQLAKHTALQAAKQVREDMNGEWSESIEIARAAATNGGVGAGGADAPNGDAGAGVNGGGADVGGGAAAPNVALVMP